MPRGKHVGSKGKHAGKPKPGNPAYNPAKGGCRTSAVVASLTLIAGLILMVLALAGCDKKPDGVHPQPTPPAVNDRNTPSDATSAVCSGTRNSYLADGLTTTVTGKALYDLSNKEGVNGRVKNAIHDMFNSNGTLINPARLNATYEHVMSVCSGAGWEPK